MSWEPVGNTAEEQVPSIVIWVKQTDGQLNGNGRKGLIQQYWEDRAFLKGAAAVGALFAGGDFVIQILRLFGVVK